MTAAPMRKQIVIRSDDMASDDFGRLFTQAFGSLYSGMPSMEKPLRIAGVYGRYEGVSFRRMVYGGDFAFELPGMADEITFVLPTAGHIVFNLATQAVGSVQAGLAVEKAHVRSVRMVDGHGQYGLSVRRSLFTERLAMLLGAPVVKPVHFHPLVDLAQPGFDGIKALVRFATSAEADSLVNASVLMPERLREMLVDAVLEAWPHTYSQALRRPGPGVAPRHVKLAMDYLRAHPSVMVSGTELAGLASVSLRALQDGFRRFAGMSIVAYQRQVRLEHARHVLEQQPAVTVGEVALKLGFTNVGRFSQYFQQAYGVRPQDVRKGLARG
ncbi:AraC family transcriptional regulator [Pseudomonas sp. Marseille-Q5115]|uniref:AraC family transcriptional regulator n=1 Tax=Pseudomonas sp. Marseille-Q5115 TaxID=2866593 RepID=UPI001CE4320D|nr:helix-turn-helix domain-containing protein [Pseudomonas sp. Marseille-Q5115]